MPPQAASELERKLRASVSAAPVTWGVASGAAAWFLLRGAVAPGRGLLELGLQPARAWARLQRAGLLAKADPALLTSVLTHVDGGHLLSELVGLAQVGAMRWLLRHPIVLP